MFFPKNQSSELLIELSEEQQETVAGGMLITDEDGYYKTEQVSYSEEKTSKGESEEFSFPSSIQFGLANIVFPARRIPFSAM